MLLKKLLKKGRPLGNRLRRKNKSESSERKKKPGKPPRLSKPRS